MLVPDTITVACSAIADPCQPVDDIVNVSEVAHLRARRSNSYGFVRKMLLPKYLNDAPIGACALAGAINVVEISDCIRQSVPVAIVRNQLGVGRLAPGIGALVPTETPIGKLGRTTSVDELACFHSPKLKHACCPYHVKVPHKPALLETDFGARVFSEVIDDVGCFGDSLGDIFCVAFSIFDARKRWLRSAREVVVERDGAVTPFGKTCE